MEALYNIQSCLPKSEDRKSYMRYIYRCSWLVHEDRQCSGPEITVVVLERLPDHGISSQ